MRITRFFSILVIGLGLLDSCMYVQLATDTVVDAVDTELNVKREFIRTDYLEPELQSRIKRIALVMDSRVDPGIVFETPVQTLWMDMVYEFTGHHKDYIVLKYLYPEKEYDLNSLCQAAAPVEGILVSQITHAGIEEEEVDLAVYLSLYDCAGKRKVWGAFASSDFDFEDEDAAQMIRSQVTRHGAVAGYYTAGFYHLSRMALRSLPSAKLEDMDLMDKIEADAIGPEGRK